jgi:putative phosphoesterase
LLRIGVLSDTHMREPSRGFLEGLKRVFESVEQVLHCGDYVDGSVLEMLHGEDWEVIGVAGNMDGSEVQRMLPPRRRIRVGNTRIGVIHGWGPPQGLERRVAQAFEDVDGVVFGHSHQPYWGYVEQVWVFNPGAACGWGSPMGCTVGILELGGRVHGRIIPIEAKRR